jgi:hypothetical protein
MENWNLLITFLSMRSKHETKMDKESLRILQILQDHTMKWMQLVLISFSSCQLQSKKLFLYIAGSCMNIRN